MTRIRFLGCDQDAFCASVARHVAEFEEASGHRVGVQLLDNDEYFTNKLALIWAVKIRPMSTCRDRCSCGSSSARDMSNRWTRLSTRASLDYDPDDFLKTLIGCNRWNGRFGEPLGKGPLLELPVNCESYNLAYLPAVLQGAGAEVPQTWDDYFAVARRITQRAAPLRGFAQRGADVWHTIYTGFASQLWSYGGRDFDKNGTCVIDSPAALGATGDILNALRDAGPGDWLNQGWYELALDFANGKYGLIVDSDHYVAYFEDPRLSSVSGRVGYSLPPLGPGGERSSNLWTWSMVMNSRSREKDAAWEFMEWATGKSHLLRSAFEGNMNPTAASVWDDATFQERAEGWGDFVAVSRHLVENVAQVLVTPAVNYIDIARRWTRALRDAYAGADCLEDCLRQAASEIDDLVAQ